MRLDLPAADQLALAINGDNEAPPIEPCRVDAHGANQRPDFAVIFLIGTAKGKHVSTRLHASEGDDMLRQFAGSLKRHVVQGFLQPIHAQIADRGTRKAQGLFFQLEMYALCESVRG